MIRLALVALFSTLVSFSAKADACSSIVPGARMGPSPTFNGWPWRNACYITWPGGYSKVDGMNLRMTYEKQCKTVPGFLHFEGDHGSNRNTCIFENASPGDRPDDPVRPSTAPEPAPQPAPAVEPLSVPDPRTLDLERTVDAQLPPATLAMRANNWEAATDRLDKTQRLASDMWLTEAYRGANQSVIDRFKTKNDLVQCLFGLSMALRSFGWGYDGFFSDPTESSECEEHRYDGFVHENAEKYRSARQAYKIELRRVKEAFATPRSNEGRLPVSNSCVEIKSSVKVSSACDFKDGVPMYRNQIGIPFALRRECPDSVKYQVIEPSTAAAMSGYATLSSAYVDTCGGPATGLRVIP